MSFRIAEKQAKKSNFKQHRVGAVIVKHGNIQATGYNQIRPSKIIGKNTLHAEAAAIKQLLDRRALGTLVGSSLYVTRFTSGGRIGMAHPCDACYSLIRSVGMRTIYYTQSDGSTGKRRVI